MLEDEKRIKLFHPDLVRFFILSCRRHAARTFSGETCLLECKEFHFAAISFQVSIVFLRRNLLANFASAAVVSGRPAVPIIEYERGTARM